MVKNTRELIIKTASALFLEKGYKGVSMTNLVKKSGLTKGAFYYYFESKELLFRAVIEGFLNVLRAQHVDNPDRTLYQFYHDAVDLIGKTMSPPGVDNGNTHSNFIALVGEASNLFPDIRNTMGDLLGQQKKLWLHFIKKAKASGEITTTMKDEHIAQLFISYSDGIGMYYYVLHQEDIEKTLLDLWDGLYRILKK
jgi:AcrR family transcriptional regulator